MKIFSLKSSSNLTGDISVNNLYEEFKFLKSSLDVVEGNYKETTALKQHRLHKQVPKNNTHIYNV